MLLFYKGVNMNTSLSNRIIELFSNHDRNSNPSSSFLINLKNFLIKSLENISLENDDMFNLLYLFGKDQDDEFNYFYETLSDSFFDFMSLTVPQLEAVFEVLSLIREELKTQELNLVEGEINRGIHDIGWIIREKNFYLNISKIFSANLVLNSNEIIDPYYWNSDLPEEKQLIEELSDIPWVFIAEETILYIEQGAEYIYLSNDACLFILPALVRFSMDYFRTNKIKDMEYIIYFLNHVNKWRCVDEKIKLFILDYLELMDDLYPEISSFNEIVCLEMWRGKTEKEAKNVARQILPKV